MKKYNLCLLVFVVFGIHALAQVQLDTSMRIEQLQEVVILDQQTDKSNQAFSFYRNSRVAGTEDILSRIEGVNLIRRGAFGMEPTLRTYQGGQINTFINGMRMYGACTDKMDPISSYIEPSNLAQLSLQQGAGKSTLGSTIGGSINFELSEALINCHRKFSGQFYSQYSSVNQATNNGFLMNYSGTKWAIRWSSIYRQAQNYRDGNGNIISHSQYQKINSHININLVANKTNSILIDFISDRGMNIGYPALPMDVAIAQAWISSVTHRKKLVSGLWESKLYTNHVTHSMDDTKRPETIIHMDMPGWSSTTGFYTKWKKSTATFDIECRVDGHHATTRADMTMYPEAQPLMYMQTLPENELNNLGGAIDWQKQLNTKHRIMGTFRYDYYYQVATSSVGILQWKGFNQAIDAGLTNQLLNAGLTWNRTGKKLQQVITLAYGNRLPTSNERLGFYLFNRADGYDYMGNFSLKPEQAYQTEWRLIRKRKTHEIQFNVFYHRIINYIYGFVIPNYSPMTLGARGVKTYDNIAFANLYGTEVNGKVLLYKNWSYQGNLRYTYASLSNRLAMQQVPPLKLISTVRYSTERFQMQFEHQWASAQQRVNPDFGEITTAAWQTFSLRFAYTRKWKNNYIQLHTAIENIFNAYYREHLSWGKIPQPGRNFIVGVNYILP